MAKLIPDAVLDIMLNEIRKRITGMSVCSTQPTSYAEATSTHKLADKNGLTSTDLTLGDGGVSGRKITLGQQSTIPVDASGSGQHIAWWGSTASILLLVTTCTAQTLTSGNTVTVSSHGYEVRDAA